MKSIYKIIGLSVTVALSFFSCDENDGIRKVDTSASNAATYSANFFFINATTDGSSLDFYVNGLNQGTAALGTGLITGYKNVSITTPGGIANTSVRAKATTGTIGGLIGSNDLIYRSTNTGFGNLTANPNGRYTFIAVDELNRPAPVRTFSKNSVTKALAADFTYYNRVSREQISKDRYTILVAAGTDVSNFASIGTVPPGCSDVGGLRYVVLTDATYPTDATIAAAVTANTSFVRFVHASINAPGVFVQLVPIATGSTVKLVTTAVTNVTAGAVGSISGATVFPTSGNVTANTYNIEVYTNATFTGTPVLKVEGVTIIAGKVYSVVARGLVGGTGASALNVAVGQHN